MKSERRPLHAIRLLAVFSFLTIAGFSAVCVRVMLDMRGNAEDLARRTLENLAASIDSDISRNIEIYDLSLRAVVNNVASPEIENVSRELRQLILFDNAATARHFGGIQVFNGSGNLTIDASSLDPATLNVADEKFFRVHRDDPDRQLFISRPIMHRGVYSVVLSRRINDRNGQFAGAAVGTIRLSYFHDVFGRLKLGEQESITVMRSDGIVLMRTPFDRDYIGRDVSGAPDVASALKEPSGSAWMTSALDGLRRLVVWQSSGKPLVVFVGRPTTAVYALWKKQAIWVGSVMTVLVVMAALMTVFLALEISRRARAEERLKELATTDSLTGLRNRRRFDDQLHLEWRRAQRLATPLALLMIDADRFKAYNDRFGHLAGDHALCAIADAVSRASRRGGDCAARYGGEEFALLLPGLGVLEALQIAEAIRRDVGSWNEGAAPLSVSIGIASMIPGEELTAHALVETADCALYEAKTCGRNQSRIGSRSAAALVA